MSKKKNTAIITQAFSFKETLHILARAFRIFHQIWPGFTSRTILTNIISALKPLIALFFSARVLNELSGARNVQTIIGYVLATVLSVFLLSVAGSLLNQWLNVHNYYNYSTLEFLYVKRYMEMDYPHIEDGQVNQMLADIRARTNGNGLGLFNLSWILPTLVGNITTLLVSLGMLAGMFAVSGTYIHNWVTSPAASIVLGLLAVLGTMTPIVMHKWQKEAMEVMNRENPKANTLFGFYSNYKDVKNAAKDIRLYHQVDAITEILEKRLNSKTMIWFFRRIAATTSVSGAVNAFIGAAIYLFIGLRALYGMYPIGSIVQYVGAVTNIVNTMSSIAGNIGSLLTNIIYMQNIYDFLDLSDPVSLGDQVPDPQTIQIEFDNVSFRYPGTDRWVLRNVSLRFKPGQRLAVVGMNGSGKTTMIKLLCRLYQPTEGVIRLNGVDIQNYRYADYVRLFNVVFQDFKLFSLSLGGNVATADAYDGDRVRNVLVTAGFGGKLDTLEKGLDTMLGKDCDKEGVSLSGGEEQKVAIARAIYRDAPFVIFDEPTAALDPISEYEVYTKLNEIVGEKTAVFISHRLSSCRFCDDIAVFHEGGLMQYGNHDTLILDKSGKYYELWNAQAQHYTDAVV